MFTDQSFESRCVLALAGLLGASGCAREDGQPTSPSEIAERSTALAAEMPGGVAEVVVAEVRRSSGCPDR